MNFDKYNSFMPYKNLLLVFETPKFKIRYALECCLDGLW